MVIVWVEKDTVPIVSAFWLLLWAFSSKVQGENGRASTDILLSIISRGPTREK